MAYNRLKPEFDKKFTQKFKQIKKMRIIFSNKRTINYDYNITKIVYCNYISIDDSLYTREFLKDNCSDPLLKMYYSRLRSRDYIIEGEDHYIFRSCMNNAQKEFLDNGIQNDLIGAPINKEPEYEQDYVNEQVPDDVQEYLDRNDEA